MTKYDPMKDKTLQKLAAGERGMPPKFGERSHRGVPFTALPAVPWPTDGGLVLTAGDDTPDRATVDAWLQELAQLSPEAHQKVLDKWNVEAVEQVDDDALREFAISARTALDAVRAVLKTARTKADIGPAKR